MRSENAYFSKELGKKALERYWDTFVMDSLLGNFDRHANNWGYLVKDATHEIMLAPVYDCGSCLYPQISDDAIPQILASEKEKNDRIYKFPNAALELSDGTKANYYKFMESMEDDECTAAIKRMYPKINMQAIGDIIMNTPGISDIRKRFYKTMIKERYEKILTPVYNKALSHERDTLDNEYECVDESFTVSLSRKDADERNKNIVR